MMRVAGRLSIGSAAGGFVSLCGLGFLITRLGVELIGEFLKFFYRNGAGDSEV